MAPRTDRHMLTSGKKKNRRADDSGSFGPSTFIHSDVSGETDTFVPVC